MNQGFVHWLTFRWDRAQPFCGFGSGSLVTWERRLLTCPRCLEHADQLADA